MREKGIKNHNKFILLNLNDYRVAKLRYPVTQASLNEMLIKLGNEADITAPKEMQWSMYSLRHTVATRLGNYSRDELSVGGSAYGTYVRRVHADVCSC